MKVKIRPNSRAYWKQKHEKLIQEVARLAEAAEDGHEEAEHADGIEETGNDDGVDGFYSCYLLNTASRNWRTYIGSTNDPRRTIKQHNGDIAGGRGRTKRKRGPTWEMIACIYGFKDGHSARQFKLAWQNLRESKYAKEAAMRCTSFYGVANQMKLAYVMLGIQEGTPWKGMNLTVNYFSKKHQTCSPRRLPNHVKVKVSHMDDLPCYNETAAASSEAKKTTKNRNNSEAKKTRKTRNKCTVENQFSDVTAPSPADDSRWKKAVIHRSLLDETCKGSVSKEMLEWFEILEELDRRDGIAISESMKLAYCAVAVECTVKPKVLEGVDEIWKVRVGGLEGKSELITEELLKIRDFMVKALLLDPDSRSAVLKWRWTNVYDALKLVEEYLKEAIKAGCEDGGDRGGRLGSEEILKRKDENSGKNLYKQSPEKKSKCDSPVAIRQSLRVRGKRPEVGDSVPEEPPRKNLGEETVNLEPGTNADAEKNNAAVADVQPPTSLSRE